MPITSKVDYRCQLYASTKPHLLIQVDIVQNTALTAMRGAYKASPINLLSAYY